jgi:hypothetical protein
VIPLRNSATQAIVAARETQFRESRFVDHGTFTTMQQKQ